MAEVLTPDICVIGAGAGGLAVATAAAAAGASVVLIERDKMGGVLLNSGAVPANALLAAARQAAAAGGAGGFGVATITSVDFHRVRDHVRDVIASLAPNHAPARLAGLGIRVIAGTARLVDMYTAAVGDIAVKARHFVIATGAAPQIPTLPGLDQTPYLTSDTIFDLAECPQHLVVLGGGPGALALAQGYRRLGAAVTVLAPSPPLAGEDAECTAIVLDALARDGVAIRTGMMVTQVRGAPGQIEVTVAPPAPAAGPGTAPPPPPGPGETISGSHLLVALARTPNIADLGLAAARVHVNEQGIIVNKRLRTGNPRIYAIGDVTGAPPFVHVATYHADVVIRQIVRHERASVNYRAIPRVVHTDPGLAHVGLVEAAVRRRRRAAIRVLRWPYYDTVRAHSERDTRGHIKVLTDANGRILGATIVGKNAADMISLWALALEKTLDIGALAALAVPHPTLAEASQQAARAYFVPSLTRPWWRRIIDLFRL